MRKNGFTLIEVLGVITLLALISTIVVLVVNKSVSDSRKTLSDVQIESIKSAASMWRTDNIELIPEDDYYIITLKTLIDGGYIKDVKNINTDENYDENLIICVGLNEINVETNSLGVPGVIALGYSGYYDGSAHGITVESSDSTIRYGTTSGVYNLDESPTYTDIGTYTVYYQVTKPGYTTITGSRTVTITKANGSISLSANSGSITYPDSTDFEVTQNLSGGELSCESSNSSVATCSISGSTVTVTPGTTQADSVNITVRSAETNNYTEASAVYVVTNNLGTLSVTANNYNGMYDGESHGITVTCSGATIKYGTTSGVYNLDENPIYTDVGTYTVYYQVSKVGYQTVTGNKTVTITKAPGSVIAPTAKTLTYNETEQELINAGSSSTGTIQYKLSGGSYSTSIPTATLSGTYTVYYRVVGDNNHNDVSENSINVTIGNGIISYVATGYNEVYDGEAHGITVTSEGSTIKYGTSSGTYNLDESPTYTDVGTYTVYYQITRTGYTTVTGSRNVTISIAYVERDDGYMYLDSTYIGNNPIYFNPTTGQICDNYVEANSATGKINGCLKWYAYSVKGNVVNMILDHNINSSGIGGVAWVSSDDYSNSEILGASLGVTNMGSGSYGNKGNHDKGPLTALKYLKTRTSNWTTTVEGDYATYIAGVSDARYRIDYTIDVNDDGVRDYKARLITAGEVANIKGQTFNETTSNSFISGLPSWLYENLGSSVGWSGYWSSSPVVDGSSHAWYVGNSGGLYCADFVDSNSPGIRPVITVPYSVVFPN